MATIISDEDFIRLWNIYESPKIFAEKENLTLRAIYRRRRALELRYKISLEIKTEIKRDKFRSVQNIYKANGKIDLGILNGTVVVFSDAHFWGHRTTSFKALLWAIQELKPVAVIANGDIFDGAGISRHARIGWDRTPTVLEELKACKDAMGEIEETAKAARHNVKLVWPLGNHDARFETFLATHAPQYQHVGGFALKDHFPNWETCWSCWANDSTVIKHRYKGGIHATHNNTVNSGKNIITGHLHSLKVTPFSDYNGDRWGVDTGCLADVDGPQFADYLELNPTNWRSGFAVLSFSDGRLLMPELVQKFSEGKVQFRGAVIDVSNF